MLPTTSAGGRSIVAKTGVAPVRTAATRHRPRNQLSRGSLTTSSGLTWKWLSSQSATADPLLLAGGDPAGLEPRLRPRVADLDAASLSSRSWWSTTHRGSPKPLGLDSSAATSGCGHVQAHDPHQPGHGAGAAAAGAGDEEHLARVRRRALVMARACRCVASGRRSDGRPDVAPGSRSPQHGRWPTAVTVRPCAWLVGDAAAQRRRAGLRRRGVPAGLPRLACSPRRDARWTGSRSSSSTTARPTSPARSPTRTPPATRGCASCTPRTAASARPATRGCATSPATCSPSPTPTTSSRPGAYAALLRQLSRTGSDFVTGSVARWEAERGWSSRRGCGGCTSRGWTGVDRTTTPEILGDVFAWNKLFRRDFWRRRPGCPGPRGCATRTSRPPPGLPAPARRFGVVPEVVYHWRIRSDGTSITQQRSSVQDLRDRWETKRMALRSVEEYGAPKVTVGLPRPGARRRPAPLLRARSRAATTSGGSCSAAGVLRDLGLPLADPQRAAAGATGWSAGWSSRVAARTPPR